jgi:hypothetical protein
VYDEPPVMQAASPLMLGGSLGGVTSVSPRRALYAPIFSRGIWPAAPSLSFDAQTNDALI